MTDRPGRLLLVTLEPRVSVRSCPVRSPSLLARLLVRIGAVERGMARQGFDLQLTRYDHRGWARDLLYDRDGALGDERDRLRVGAHAVASGPGAEHSP